jgi:uncharacterized protein
MLRLSSYSIISEPLPGGGYAILNGLSGAVDLISKEMAQYLINALVQADHREIYIHDEDFHPETRDEFLERGHLTRLSHDAERTQLIHVANLLHETEQKNLRFLIVPNLDCNYCCTYCFEKLLHMSLGTRESMGLSRVVLDSTQIHTIYNCINKLRTEVNQTGPAQLILYGGEPLDRNHKDIIFELVNKGKDRGFAFAAVTNGHDLDAFLSLFGKDGINQVQVTFDGPPHIHDKRRISKRGDSSFQTIKNNVNSLLELEEQGVQVQVRAHVDQTSVDYFEELLDIFESEGWLNNENVLIYTSTIYHKDEQGKVSADIENEKIENYLINITGSYENIIIGAPSANIRGMLWNSLKESQPYRLRSNYCAANTGMYIFAPDGHIYACWESIGKECSRIGSYTAPDQMVFNLQMKEKWFNRSVSRIPECLECPYCLICAGGCSQYSYYNSETLLKPFCDNFYKIFPHAFASGVENFLNCVDKKTVDNKAGDFCL